MKVTGRYCTLKICRAACYVTHIQLRFKLPHSVSYLVFAPLFVFLNYDSYIMPLLRLDVG